MSLSTSVTCAFYVLKALLSLLVVANYKVLESLYYGHISCFSLSILLYDFFRSHLNLESLSISDIPTEDEVNYTSIRQSLGQDKFLCEPRCRIY